MGRWKRLFRYEVTPMTCATFPRLLSVFVLILAPLVIRAEAPPVEIMRTPEGGLMPQACTDANGTVHLIYTKDAATGPSELLYTRLRQARRRSPRRFA